MPTILAERLKAEADKKGFTQEKLAEAVGISREQCGKHLRKTGPVRINDTTARGYERVFGLSREELSKPPQRDKDTPTGWNRVLLPLSDEELLTLRLTEMRYGMDGHSILRMSPALFMIVAELQLAERAKRVADAEACILSFPDGLDHLADALNCQGQIEVALRPEMWGDRFIYPAHLIERQRVKRLAKRLNVAFLYLVNHSVSSNRTCGTSVIAVSGVAFKISNLHSLASRAICFQCFK